MQRFVESVVVVERRFHRQIQYRHHLRLTQCHFRPSRCELSERQRLEKLFFGKFNDSSNFERLDTFLPIRIQYMIHLYLIRQTRFKTG